MFTLRSSNNFWETQKQAQTRTHNFRFFASKEPPIFQNIPTVCALFMFLVFCANFPLPPKSRNTVYVRRKWYWKCQKIPLK